MKAPLKISSAARREIDAGLERLRPKAGGGLIPAIMWVDSDLNSGNIETGVLVGAYTAAQRSELVGQISDDHGYEFVLAVPDHELIRFLGKTLDFTGGKFVLL